MFSKKIGALEESRSRDIIEGAVSSLNYIKEGAFFKRAQEKKYLSIQAEMTQELARVFSKEISLKKAQSLFLQEKERLKAERKKTFWKNLSLKETSEGEITREVAWALAREFSRM